MPITFFRAALSLVLAAATALPLAAQENAGAYLSGRQAQIDGDYAQSAESFGRALRQDPGNAALMDATLTSLLALGDVDRAAVVGRQIVTSGSDSQAGSLVLFGKAARDGDWTDLLDDLDAGQSVGPLFDQLVEGWALVGAGRPDDASAVFDDLAAQQGVEAFGHYHKALALASAGRWDEADAVLAAQDGLQLTRRGTMARVQILSQAGRNDDAVDLLSQTFGENLDGELRDVIGRLEAGDVLEFTVAPDAAAGLGEAYFSIAGALMNDAGAGYSLLYVRMAQYMAPDNVDAMLLSADLLERMEQYDLAIEAFRQVPRDHPIRDVAELGRAEVMRRAGRTDAAIEVLQQLAASRPDADVLVTLGDALRTEERFAEARDVYDRAIAVQEGAGAPSWFVYFARGITHERGDDFEAAEADFRRALDLSPDQPQVLNYLGYSYVEQGRNLEEALEMIERAVAARPDSGYIVDSLGWAFYRLGRYDEAVAPMETAVSLMPIDPVLNDHLGDVLWAVGRQLEARFQWKRALSFAEDDAEDISNGLEPDRIRRKLEIGLDAVLAEEGAPPIRRSAAVRDGDGAAASAESPDPEADPEKDTEAGD